MQEANGSKVVGQLANTEHDTKVAVINPAQPIGQPLPDAGLTQAEYERVVKGVKLSDPVDAGISRSCTQRIHSVCTSPSGQLHFGCYHGELHVVADSKTDTIVKKHKSKLRFPRHHLQPESAQRPSDRSVVGHQRQDLQRWPADQGAILQVQWLWFGPKI